MPRRPARSAPVRRAVLAAASLLLAPALASAGPPAAPAGYESLPGLETVIFNQIQAALGADRLPIALGVPLEPGIYVTLAKDRAWVFDRPISGIVQGRFEGPAPDAAGLAELRRRREAGDLRLLGCLSGCSQPVFDALVDLWRALVAESRALGVDVPNRILIAADAELPASLVVETAYAASETRPGSPPLLQLVVGGAAGGLRVRPFALLPPRGLVVPMSQRPLAFTIECSATALRASSLGGGGLAAAEFTELAGVVRYAGELKKRNPGKTTVVIDVGDASVGQIVGLMVALQESFPRVVLKAGQPLRLG